jgi:hypothetical protein
MALSLGHVNIQSSQETHIFPFMAGAAPHRVLKLEQSGKIPPPEFRCSKIR